MRYVMLSHRSATNERAGEICQIGLILLEKDKKTLVLKESYAPDGGISPSASSDHFVSNMDVHGFWQMKDGIIKNFVEFELKNKNTVFVVFDINETIAALKLSGVQCDGIQCSFIEIKNKCDALETSYKTLNEAKFALGINEKEIEEMRNVGVTCDRHDIIREAITLRLIGRKLIEKIGQSSAITKAQC